MRFDRAMAVNLPILLLSRKTSRKKATRSPTIEIAKRETDARALVDVESGKFVLSPIDPVVREGTVEIAEEEDRVAVAPDLTVEVQVVLEATMSHSPTRETPGDLERLTRITILPRRRAHLWLRTSAVATSSAKTDTTKNFTS